MSTSAGPLAGCRVVITRERSAADELAAEFARFGASPIGLPTLQIAPPADASPLAAALGRLEDVDWLVFTSPNAVTATLTALFLQDDVQQSAVTAAMAAPRTKEDARPRATTAAMAAPHSPDDAWQGDDERKFALFTARVAKVRVAAVGSETARALAAYGLHAEVVPDEHTARHLAQALGAHPSFAAGQRVLLPRSQLARPDLLADLEALGAVVNDVVAYRTIAAPPEAEALAALREGCDVVTFTSGSAAVNFMALVGRELPTDILAGAWIASIGPSTSAVVRQLGAQVDVEAVDHTAKGLVAAVVDAWGAAKGPATASSSRARHGHS